MRRKDFIKNAALTGIGSLALPSMEFLSTEESRELLYNGIKLPKVWPPEGMDPGEYRPMPVPYLSSPPEVIPIDVGRQLFVDDFLIERTNLCRTFHQPRKLENNPILKTNTPLEENPSGVPGAAPKDGGVWWDPQDHMFKMWYEAGWLSHMAYATSPDGLNWERPDLDVKSDTNMIVPKLQPDSTTVFLDHFTNNPNERFKMFLRSPGRWSPGQSYSMVSPDGIHWRAPVQTGVCGDRSTVFYNPFRKKWVYSIRSTDKIAKHPHGRARYYREHDDFLKGAKWNTDDLVFWTGADDLDLPDPEVGNKPQLYNLSAVGYESLMLGLHQIHLGPPNKVCMRNGFPKITELMTSFSRDGFHWDRPDREAFIPATRKKGSWERGYVQSVGGICAIVGDELWFYYIGYRGDETKPKPEAKITQHGMYSHGSTGVAVLRRDGFASMATDGKDGILTTRPVTFEGRFLFVNVDCPQGELKVEILHKDHATIAPFSRKSCTPVSTDSTIQQISWKDSEDLSSLVGREVRFRFHLKRGKLYSFWLSPDKSGASKGFNAAGGPGFNGGIDAEGKEAYQQAKSFQLM